MKFLLHISMLALLVVAPVTIFTTGCAKRQSISLPTAPAARSEYRITQSLAILVESNKGATQALIQLNQNGMVDDLTTMAILGHNALIARASKDALLILDGSRTWPQKNAAIASLFVTLTSNPDVKDFIDKNIFSDAGKGVASSLQAVQLIVASVMAEVR